MTLLVLLLSLILVQDPPDTGPYDLAFAEVVDSVYVAYRPEATRRPVHGNITIIVNKDDVVVVDAGASPSSARQIVDFVRTHTANPISAVILTHGHDDHVLGTQVLRDAFPDAEVIARQGTRDYLTNGRVQGRVESFAANLAQRRAGGEEEKARVAARGMPGDAAILADLRRYYDADVDVIAREHENLSVVPPTLTFETKLVLARGGRDIEILNLGPGKSGSAAIVYLPAERVVIAGDVVTHPVPYGFTRDSAGWLETLQRLDALDFATLIPGHGDVLHGKDYLRQVIGLAEFTLAEVEDAVMQGLDKDATRRRIDFAAMQEGFTHGDPLLNYRFETWYLEPVMPRTHQALSIPSEE